MTQPLPHAATLDPAGVQSSRNHNQKRQGLPVSIHPDDAKDKVFTAILKALLKMENKPSSPKELANVIIKHKYATLGGATPFATVSSRISQHFKRAAEHNPPRAPLLAKHVDQNHSRKINYSLATDESRRGTPASSAAVAATAAASSTAEGEALSESSDEDSDMTCSKTQHRLRRARKARRHRRTTGDVDAGPHDADDESELDFPAPKRLRHTAGNDTPFTPDTELSPLPAQPQPWVHPLSLSVPAPTDDESEADYSDYHEDMLKSDEHMAGIDVCAPSRPNLARRPSTQFPSEPAFPRKPSFSLPSRTAAGSNLLGEQDVWMPFSFEQDFDSVFMSNHTPAPHASFNIATPESIPVSELDTYFNNSNNHGNTSPSSTSYFSSQASSSSSSNPSSVSPAVSTAARTNRKSFSSAAFGSKEASLLHRALLASAARDASISDTGSVSDREEDEYSVALPILAQRRRSWPEVSKPSSPMTTAAPDVTFTSELTTCDTFSVDVKKGAQAVWDAEIDEEDTKGDPTEMHFSKGGFDFTISRKTIGNLECFELSSLKDIPDTKVFRYIASTDGTSEHIALRTRHADKDKRTNQYAYLAEGYVNATQLRKAARPVLGKGNFEASAETEHGRVVVTITKGPMDCRGSWVPLSRARELLEEFEIESSPSLCQFLSDHPMSEDGTAGPENEPALLDSQADSDSLSSVLSTLSPESSSKDPDSQASLQYRRSFDSSSAGLNEDDAFVKFEDDEKRPDDPGLLPTVVSHIDAPNVVAMALEPLAASNSNNNGGTGASGQSMSPAEILKSLGLQNLNLSALQQMTAAIPSLAHLGPSFDLARSLSTYMQSMSKSAGNTPATTPPSPSSQPPSTLDVKATLARFPALEALLKKSALPSPVSSPVSPAPVSPLPMSVDDPAAIATTVPTDPPMYITMVDSIALCVAVFERSDDSPPLHIMRRLDTGFINGTTLLTAGGIETDSERSMILSFEMDRKRVPKKKSALFGTWIPLRRAQQLAVTCSIQHRLGPFLDDHIESYFPSPLPFAVPAKRPIKEGRLSSLALAALRNSSDVGLTPSRESTLSHPTAAQLQELMLTHPHKTLKIGKAPLLGSFEENEESDLRRRKVVSTPVSRRSSEELATDLTSKKPKSESDVEVVSNESDDDTDTDTDVEEVRLRMRKIRDAAIDAMENGSSMDLEEMLSRASTPIAISRKPLIRAPPMPPPRRRQRQLSGERQSALKMHLPASYSQRRRLTGGKYSANGGSGSGGGGKIMPSMIKRSASWNGALSMPRSTVVTPTKRQATKKTRRSTKNMDERMANRVVKHSVNPVKIASPQSKLPTVEEDDEDEEIDIGGSDRDDDLR